MEHVILEVAVTMEGADGAGPGTLRVSHEHLTFHRRKRFGGRGAVTRLHLSAIKAATLSGEPYKVLTVRADTGQLVFTPAGGNGAAALEGIGDLLRRAIAGEPPPGPPPQSPETLEALDRLTKLHAVGALSHIEFAHAKRKLLGHD